MARSAPPELARLPRAPGVYRFRDAGGRVLYIGRATTLRSRVASYWSDLRDRAHLAPMVASIDRVEAVTCDSRHEAAWLERNLLRASMPPWNLTPGGQESQVYLRLDTRPGAPGLRVARDRRPGTGLRYFGPYLGGLQARQAVAGLNRILPLAYLGEGLGGTQRALARARGATGTDRDTMIATLAAVLDREPGAVAWARAELTALRDQASQRLAFEFAARMQGEIEALDWVTSPQRVTTASAADFDVHGWSAGLLVHFGFRRGTLRLWSQRRCSAGRAAGYLAGTPTAWSAFAQRNADLAAALSPATAAPVLSS
jgi:excinuclease ABC subunit C